MNTSPTISRGLTLAAFASLLAVVVLVLGGIAAFFIYIARKSGPASATGAAAPSLETTEKV